MEGKNLRFFFAEFILSGAEGLLRTAGKEAQNDVSVHLVRGPKR
jgi:hypothetical protein